MMMITFIVLAAILIALLIAAAIHTKREEKAREGITRALARGLEDVREGRTMSEEEALKKLDEGEVVELPFDRIAERRRAVREAKYVEKRRREEEINRDGVDLAPVTYVALDTVPESRPIEHPVRVSSFDHDDFRGGGGSFGGDNSSYDSGGDCGGGGCD